MRDEVQAAWADWTAAGVAMAGYNTEQSADDIDDLRRHLGADQIDLDVDEMVLLVGPEGGIGAEELAQLTAAGARAVKLGPEVLRTASAAMVALSAIGVLKPRW